MSRRFRLAAAAAACFVAATIGLVATGPSPAAHAASAPPALTPAPGTIAVPNGLISSAAGTLTSTSLCSQVTTELATYAAQGVANVSCVASLSASANGSNTPSAAGAQPAASGNNAADQCALNDEVNVWYYAREWFCFIDEGAVVNTIDTSNGAVIGQANYAINHASGFDPRSGTWDNFTSFYINSEWGDASDIVYSTSQCGGCNWDQVGYPLAGPTTVPLQKAVVGDNALADNPAPGAIDGGISVYWNDEFKSPDSTPGFLTYTSPIAVRCDAQANTGAAQGCAIPSYIPQLQVTGYSSDNTSTAYIDFFQANNADHWGQYPSGSLLTRLNNPTQATANRNAMCYSGAFTANPVVTNDSCDEFPFASTYQSGAMLGLTGSQCSQLLPEYISATSSWVVYEYPGYSASQRCGLGHVTQSDNYSTGGMYSAFIQNNRVLDQDAFWLGIFN